MKKTKKKIIETEEITPWYINPDPERIAFWIEDKNGKTIATVYRKADAEFIIKARTLEAARQKL